MPRAARRSGYRRFQGLSEKDLIGGSGEHSVDSVVPGGVGAVQN